MFAEPWGVRSDILHIPWNLVLGTGNLDADGFAALHFRSDQK
jgi:hypothetical protein